MGSGQDDFCMIGSCAGAYISTSFSYSEDDIYVIAASRSDGVGGTL